MTTPLEHFDNAEIHDLADQYGISAEDVRRYIGHGWDPDYETLDLSDAEPVMCRVCRYEHLGPACDS